MSFNDDIEPMSAPDDSKHRQGFLKKAKSISGTAAKYTFMPGLGLAGTRGTNPFLHVAALHRRTQPRVHMQHFQMALDYALKDRGDEMEKAVFESIIAEAGHTPRHLDEMKNRALRSINWGLGCLLVLLIVSLYVATHFAAWAAVILIVYSLVFIGLWLLSGYMRYAQIRDRQVYNLRSLFQRGSK